MAQSEPVAEDPLADLDPQMLSPDLEVAEDYASNLRQMKRRMLWDRRVPRVTLKTHD